MAKKRKPKKKVNYIKLSLPELHKAAIKKGIKNVNRKSQAELIQELTTGIEVVTEPEIKIEPKKVKKYTGKRIILLGGRQRIGGRVYTPGYIDDNQETARILYSQIPELFEEVCD